MTGRITVVTAMISFLFSSSSAQKVIVANESQAPRRLFHSYISAGGVRMDVEDLNDRLEETGIPEISDNGLSIGLGMDAVYKRFVHSMNIVGLFWAEGDNGPLESDMGGIYAQTSFGFELLNHARFRLFPQLGLGIGGLRLRINQENIEFSETLTEPSSTREFWQMGVLLGVGLGASYTFGVDGRDKNVVLGIRGGYWYDPTDRDDWFIDYTDVQNGPKAGFTGPYAKITVGKEISGKQMKRRLMRR